MRKALSFAKKEWKSMATNERPRKTEPENVPQKSTSGAQKSESSQAAQPNEESPVQKAVGPLRAFFTKVINDWTINLQARALAYNLVVAIFPILLALFLLFGLVLGSSGASVQKSFLDTLERVLPQGVGSGIVQQMLRKIQSSAGILSIITLLTAIIGGSRLFVLMENCFDLIYHLPPRRFLMKNMVAIGMLLLFAILIPLMLLASIVPALLTSFLKTTPLQTIPAGPFIFSLLGVLGSLVISWMLFEAIYSIVPNQPIRFRNSWRGAIIAAIGLQIYLTLFPFYATHFLKGYGGQAGFALILIIFFYYFAILLLLGAQVNAFFAEGVQKTPDNLASLVHKETSLNEKPSEEQHAQATPPHKQDMDQREQTS